MDSDAHPQQKEGHATPPDGNQHDAQASTQRRELSPHSPPSVTCVERPARHTPPLGSRRAIVPLRYRSGGHVACTPENATYLRFGQKRKFTILPVVDMLTLLTKSVSNTAFRGETTLNNEKHNKGEKLPPEILTRDEVQALMDACS